MNQAPHILTIDLAAIAANYRLLQAKSGSAAVGASIKADAYGLGAAAVAPVLEAAGCRDFFVATVDEGMALRAFTRQNIFIFGGMRAGEQAALAEFELMPALNSLADIAAYKGPAAVFFDTGMNRLGLGADETATLIADPALLRGIDVKLFLSQFACSEDAAHPMNLAQCARIEAIRTGLKPHFPHARWSMCNSGGVYHYPQAHYDLVRPGYALYGGNPAPEATNPMHPVVKLEARILQTRDVKAGESIGYSATHVFDAPTRTATICMGYADGFMRSHSGKSHVYWQGQACPVLGRVSMDLVTIGIGHLQNQPQAGDLLEVLGPHQEIDALAATGGTIGYEILTGLGHRYRRLYKD
ncbi:MAG: alanine racemase [Alphaproteobacteria bacterium]|nr:alanine racemase [Alphaproteobacteria bacterium]